MSEKRVDESWKEQVEKEKQTPQEKQSSTEATAQPIEPAAPEGEPVAVSPEGEMPQARFDLFISGLAMEAMVAMGDIPHPTTHQQTINLPQAKYLIDLIGIIEQKSQGNLTVDEEKLMKDAIYQLRMRYLSKAGAGTL